jgi:hypothetical protein
MQVPRPIISPPQMLTLSSVNKSPDYSGAFVILRTSIPNLKAYGAPRISISSLTHANLNDRDELYQRIWERSGLSCTRNLSPAHSRKVSCSTYRKYGADLAAARVWSDSLDWARGMIFPPPTPTPHTFSNSNRVHAERGRAHGNRSLDQCCLGFVG